MRKTATILAAWSVLSLLTEPTLAETLKFAKVYRDYPGYINPALCENPNLGKPPAPATVAQEIKVPVPPPVESPTVQSPPVQLVPAAKAPAVVMPSSSDPVTPPGDPVAAEKLTPAPALPTPTISPAACPPSDSPIFWDRADDPVNAPYMTVWAGMVATHDADVDAGGSHGEVSFDHGFAGGLAVGYDFGPARLEVEGGYRDSNAKEGDADLKIQTVMVNAYADFKTGGMATPYLGAGVGYANVEVGNHDDEVIAGQVGAGVLIAVSQSVAVDLGYRFMMTDDPDIGDADFEVRQHTALLGLQVRF